MLFRIMCIIFVIGPRFVVIVRKLAMSCADRDFVSIRAPNRINMKKPVPMTNSIAGLRCMRCNSMYVSVAVIAEDKRIFAEDIQSMVRS